MLKTESSTPTPPTPALGKHAGVMSKEVHCAPTKVKIEPEKKKSKTMAPTSESPPAPTKVTSRAQECPMFLRKTYHMVDTCDPAVASWSDDGETFIVKNTDVFEKDIIPQFFKHSKFSSFVRQLNFYGFRKIKYHESIRIDPKLEAETANFWRFHHEKFRKGRPDLLIAIKRHGGKETVSGNPPGANANVPAAKVTPVVEKAEDVLGVKSEVTVLKERIAAMSKNIDQLTNLIQKISVTQASSEDGTAMQVERSKRIKVKEESMDEQAVLPDIPFGDPAECSSATHYSPADMFPSAPPSRQQSLSSGGLSDDEFLDDLVHVLDEENVDGLARDSVVVGLSAGSSLTTPVTPKKTDAHLTASNRPDPQLMEELGDALSALPKDVQEMLIRRLISTISNKDSVKGHVDAASALSRAAVVECDEDKTSSKLGAVSQESDEHRLNVGLPMAAVTLGALLSQYGMANANKVKNCAPKSILAIPVHQKIPVHA